MSRKHNCPKRGQHARSHCGERLEKRGLRAAPVMAGVEDLRLIQAARETRTGSPWPGSADLEGER